MQAQSDLVGIDGQADLDLPGALEHIREMYVAMMKSLARVVEAKDECTRGHLDRAQAYGLALARRVAPDLARRPATAFGFFLHDLGKVGIPEKVLCKPGPLTLDEWGVMRAHPMIGAQILEPFRFLAEAVSIVRHHHERFDGSGYPYGLAGTDIPLAARIFSVADCFDAMTSDRPYRAAMPVSAALEEIRANAGTQFDPEVTGAFFDLIREGDAFARPEQQALLRAV
ncbi:MAG TPA: HD-GYP domain-containing protein [Actinomycetota bacterium]|jgi:ribonuclease P protein subunit RPR2